MQKTTFKLFEEGTLSINSETINLASIPWKEHKDFTGVFLKHIIPVTQTDGRFSCLLVHITPGNKIGLHTHPNETELHEVIAGSGTCCTECGDIPYTTGTMAVLACNAPHEVKAGKDGLYLFAKFIAVAS